MELLLCYAAIGLVLIMFFTGTNFTISFSAHFQASFVEKSLVMLVILLCLVGVVHYLIRTNDHYMQEIELSDLPFSSVFQIDDPFPPWSPASDPSSYYPAASYTSSSPAASYPSSSSTPSYPPSSPTTSYPPSSPAASYPSSSSFWPWSPESDMSSYSPAASYPSSSSPASYPPSSPTASYPPSSPAASYPSSSSFSSFSSPPHPPFRVRPPTFIMQGDVARMVSDFSLSLSEDSRFEDSGDSDIDTKAGKFITEIKNNRKLERRIKTRMAKKV